MIRDEIEKFFAGKVPPAWRRTPVEVEFDDDEILCTVALASDASVDGFRESTRSERMDIASQAESKFGRKVSWAVERDGRRTLFTNQSTPVMTRLRLPERAILDTLIDAGVARSRSDALSWCVKLVGRHQAEWLSDLRGALVDVERVRGEGPALI
jgi:hypothetical protein